LTTTITRPKTFLSTAVFSRSCIYVQQLCRQTRACFVCCLLGTVQEVWRQYRGGGLVCDRNHNHHQSCHCFTFADSPLSCLLYFLYQGCTTYFTDSARNISGWEVRGRSGGLGTVPPVGPRSKAPGHAGRGSGPSAMYPAAGAYSAFQTPSWWERLTVPPKENPPPLSAQFGP